MKVSAYCSIVVGVLGRGRTALHRVDASRSCRCAAIFWGACRDQGEFGTQAVASSSGDALLVHGWQCQLVGDLAQIAKQEGVTRELTDGHQRRQGAERETG